MAEGLTEGGKRLLKAILKHDDYKLIKSILMVTNQWEVGMTEGLTKGGKRLLKAILKHDSYAVLCADVIEDFLRDQKHAKTVWYHKNGVLALDADNGVTYDDYKLIKSILMVTNQWEF